GLPARISSSTLAKVCWNVSGASGRPQTQTERRVVFSTAADMDWLPSNIVLARCKHSFSPRPHFGGEGERHAPSPPAPLPRSGGEGGRARDVCHSSRNGRG